MKDQRKRVRCRGTPKAVWLIPREDGEQDKYEVWSGGVITVCRNPTGNYRTMQYLVREPK